MCVICHEETHDNPVSIDMVKGSDEARAAEHGDGNANCIRVVQVEPEGSEFTGSSYLNDKGESFVCVDCSEMVRAMDIDDHCCYDAD